MPTNGDRLVALLAELLRLHGHEPWYASAHLHVGDRFEQEIDDAITRAEAMIVVVSRSTVGSKYVTRVM